MSLCAISGHSAPFRSVGNYVPVVVTAIVAILLSREDCAPLAYIAGSLGTLIGADLTNLDKVRGLGAPVASIGGAGTFDGIFLTGMPQRRLDST
jgi:uncharacterized membrane protein